VFVVLFFFLITVGKEVLLQSKLVIGTSME